MTDRELLELAAKAAGIELWHEDVFTNGITQKVSDNGVLMWNPLVSDGDALRLFCALPWLCIETSDLAATVLERRKPNEPSRVYLKWTEWLNKHNDLAAATRRAIVRAAAEIGRNIK